ncbi:MAG: hypothetical protein ACE5EG_03205 [Thermoanaerobaculia bacterium]
MLVALGCRGAEEPDTSSPEQGAGAAPAAIFAPGVVSTAAPEFAGGWGEPVPLAAPVNSPATEVFTSLSAAGSLYFGSDRDGVFDVYRAAASADGFQESARLGLAREEHTAGNPSLRPPRL